MPSDGPNLPSLVAALRNPPADFEWDYSTYSGCALALAALLWPEHAPSAPPLWRRWGQAFGFLAYRHPWQHWGQVFGLSKNAAYVLFWGAWARKNKLASEVTPNDVADLIEAHLRAPQEDCNAVR